jgi:hypothetical protein
MTYDDNIRAQSTPRGSRGVLPYMQAIYDTPIHDYESRGFCQLRQLFLSRRACLNHCHGAVRRLAWKESKRAGEMAVGRASRAHAVTRAAPPRWEPPAPRASIRYLPAVSDGDGRTAICLCAPATRMSMRRRVAQKECPPHSPATGHNASPHPAEAIDRNPNRLEREQMERGGERKRSDGSVNSCLNSSFSLDRSRN